MEHDTIEGGSGSVFGQMYKAFQEVIFLTQRTSLHTFGDMWKYIFIWSFCSAVFVHMIAALIAFGTLRKHKFGRLFSVLILFVGVIMTPITSSISSAAIAFVHDTGNLSMSPIYAIIYGVGQTIIAACIGFTRILATL